MTDCSSHFISTRGSSLKRDPDKQFEFVAYKSYKKVQKSDNFAAPASTTSKRNEFQKDDFKKAKHEIVKLGMSALDPTKKEEAKVQLAIRLGAKPPKNKYINYKQLLQEKKKDKDKVNEQNKLNQIGKNKVGKSTAKGKSFDRKRKKVKGSSILGAYGKARITTAKSNMK